MADARVRWVATLSDGSTVVEDSGEFVEVPGERKPWVKLCSYLGGNGLHLTSLRLNFKGRTIHLPRANFDRFAYNEISRAPLFYSLQYHHEAIMDQGFAIQEEEDFIDLAAHYPNNLAVHYIQSLDKENSWVVVTDSHNAMAGTPAHVSE